MRENRPYGSEGGEAETFPTPIEAHESGIHEHRPVIMDSGLPRCARAPE
jgi:hypothetical protein